MTQTLTIHAITSTHSDLEASAQIDGTFESLHEGADNLMTAFPEIRTVYRVTIDGEPIIFEQDGSHLYVEDDRASNMGLVG